jgi:hypothetical protein
MTVTARLIPFGQGDPADGMVPVFVHPRTGEVFTLTDCTADDLIGLHVAARTAQDHAKTARAMLEAEIDKRRRETAGAGKSLRGDSLEIVRSVSRRWDTGRTVSALKELVDLGLVTVHEADALTPEVTTRKPDGRGLMALFSRLIDAGELEATQLLLTARSETARWEVVE